MARKPAANAPMPNHRRKKPAVKISPMMHMAARIIQIHQMLEGIVDLLVGVNGKRKSLIVDRES
jgi:hypothetical protein